MVKVLIRLASFSYPRYHSLALSAARLNGPLFRGGLLLRLEPVK
jgi:hypothetical protein